MDLQNQELQKVFRGSRSRIILKQKNPWIHKYRKLPPYLTSRTSCFPEQCHTWWHSPWMACPRSPGACPNWWESCHLPPKQKQSGFINTETGWVYECAAVIRADLQCGPGLSSWWTETEAVSWSHSPISCSSGHTRGCRGCVYCGTGHKITPHVDIIISREGKAENNSDTRSPSVSSSAPFHIRRLTQQKCKTLKLLAAIICWAEDKPHPECRHCEYRTVLQHLRRDGGEREHIQKRVTCCLMRL